MSSTGAGTHLKHARHQHWGLKLASSDLNYSIVGLNVLCWKKNICSVKSFVDSEVFFHNCQGCNVYLSVLEKKKNSFQQFDAATKTVLYRDGFFKVMCFVFRGHTQKTFIFLFHLTSPQFSVCFSPLHGHTILAQFTVQMMDWTVLLSFFFFFFLTQLHIKPLHNLGPDLCGMFPAHKLFAILCWSII